MKLVVGFVIACGMWGASAEGALSQTAKNNQRPTARPLGGNDIWALPTKDAVNLGTATVVTGPVGGMFSIMGTDMSRVLDDGESLRVLPVLGKGPVQNVIDLLFLKSIDMGMVMSDAPEFFKVQYNVPDISPRLRYITKLFNSEIQIVAPTSIRTIFDLQGKRILANKDTAYYSLKAIFSRLGITADIDYEFESAAGLLKVKEGGADAWVINSAKGIPTVLNLKNDDRRLHIVTIPYDPRLRDLYLPTVITSDDYPNLIPAGQKVETISSSAMLVSVDWPKNTERYNRVAKFVDALFSRIGELHKPPRHPKWKEASITAAVPGWIRFKPAQDWIDSHASGQAETSGQAGAPARPMEAEFKDFLKQRGVGQGRRLSEDELLKLYGAFVEWSRASRR